jgi:hypothetical protein
MYATAKLIGERLLGKFPDRSQGVGDMYVDLEIYSRAFFEIEIRKYPLITARFCPGGY